jgi:glyoxylase-like metal-dependent hydrolase (beta-lactamase superfamily II)
MPVRGGELEAAPIIEAFTLGPFETNTYLVYGGTEGAAKACWVVDPSFGPEPVIERIGELGLTPAAIVLTHAHVDHIAGVDEVLRAFPGTPVWVHEAEARWLAEPTLNLSAGMGMRITARGPDRTLREGETLDLDGLSWKVLHTPGHSPGGITLHHAPSRTAIVGDTLFAGSVGRTDFPGSDPRTLAASIRQKLYMLADDTKALPGHGPPTTIAQEKRTNPFVRAHGGELGE